MHNFSAQQVTSDNSYNKTREKCSKEVHFHACTDSSRSPYQDLDPMAVSLTAIWNNKQIPNICQRSKSLQSRDSFFSLPVHRKK